MLKIIFQKYLITKELTTQIRFTKILLIPIAFNKKTFSLCLTKKTKI